MRIFKASPYLQLFYLLSNTKVRRYHFTNQSDVLIAMCMQKNNKTALYKLFCLNRIVFIKA